MLKRQKIYYFTISIIAFIAQTGKASVSVTTASIPILAIHPKYTLINICDQGHA